MVNETLNVIDITSQMFEYDYAHAYLFIDALRCVKRIL